jgi:Kef-type K+ transport system membrane component KefB
VTASVHQNEHLLFTILVQLIVMIAAARILNTVFRKFRQPGSVGEIVAGLALGPSLFGHFFPLQSVALFGAAPSPAITVISQVGLILLMFQIGIDFEFSHLKTRRNRNGTLLIAALSVSVPLILGISIGRLSAPVLAPTMDAVTYSLFVGVALAITAVPILGRILREYDLTTTEIGVVVISAAAVNDVVGWILLAGVSAYATAQFSLGQMGLQVGGLAVFVVALWFVLRPLVDRLVARFPVRGAELSPNLMGITVCLMLFMAICTFKLGIFAIFGGFAAGLLFHHHHAFVAAWRRQVGQFVMVFFLPVFFTFTGLRTNILGLSSLSDLQWLSIVVAAAVLGKIIPVYIAGRMTGFSHDESSVMGSLMNTRALMELIVLNVGYDLGFIPQSMFTMLVVMAVVTTMMTGPLLRVLLPRLHHAIPVGIEA